MDRELPEKYGNGINLRSCIGFAVLFILFALLLPVQSGSAQQPLKLGVHPYLASSELIRRFTPLAEYLSAALNRPVTIELSNSYNTHIQKIGNDMLHVAFMGPASYIIMTEQFGKKPILATFESNGNKVFRGAIIAKKGSPIHSLRQLKGKKFAFGDPESTMGHIVPRYMLLQKGVDMRDLSIHMHLANHDNIALSVLAGNFDAGAVKQEIYNKYKDEGLKAIVLTPEMNDHLFVASSLLPRQTILALRRALLGLKQHKDGKRILELLRPGVTGLVPADDDEYDTLREIISNLKRAGVQL